MCGIAGFIGIGNRADLNSMSQALIARGPDDDGKYIDEENSIYFAHRRLSILDIKDGHQPMQDDDIVVVFNGEIYNAIQLRKSLSQEGYKFKTSHSDTEILIHGYKKWGQDLPKFLNGMFAFTIYDKRKQKIFLARDRFGEKPLYYFYDSKNFVFSSELNSLTKHKLVTCDINELALQKYFAYGYIPAPLTIYNNCFKLKPGSVATLNLNNNKIDFFTYWNFSLQPDYNIKSENEVIEELDYLLEKSVKSRLISDVPLGIFLSGGLDSSAILYYANKALNKNDINTFTIGFSEKSFDESIYAKEVARFFGVKNYNEILDDNKIKNLIPTILQNLDEPISDSSIIPTYFLCNHAAKHIKTALSGDGGDELFAGYDPFAVLKFANFYDKIIPKFLHKQITNLSDLLPVSHNNLSFDLKVKRGLRGLSQNKNLWNPVWMAPISHEHLKELFFKPIKITDLYSEAITLWDKNNNLDIVDKTLEFYTNIYLPNNILAKTDKASMMNSLEVRSPFLDNDLVEFVQKLPNRFKYNNGSKKYILKKLLSNKLPTNVVQRKKKGFGAPIAKTIANYNFRTDNISNELINHKSLNSLYKNHKDKKQDNGVLIWSYVLMAKFLSK